MKQSGNLSVLDVFQVACRKIEGLEVSSGRFDAAQAWGSYLLRLGL